MVRVYRRKPGARRYADYTPEKLEECLEAIKSGTLSHRKAAEHFNIPRRTILNKLKGHHMKKPGKQTVLSESEEEGFVKYVDVMSAFGFPLTALDLRYRVKSYVTE
jgi:hypothetical protein